MVLEGVIIKLGQVSPIQIRLLDNDIIEAGAATFRSQSCKFRKR